MSGPTNGFEFTSSQATPNGTGSAKGSSGKRQAGARLTDEEYALVEAKADELGLGTVANMVRFALKQLIEQGTSQPDGGGEQLETELSARLDRLEDYAQATAAHAVELEGKLRACTEAVLSCLVKAEDKQAARDYLSRVFEDSPAS